MQSSQVQTLDLPSTSGPQDKKDLPPWAKDLKIFPLDFFTINRSRIIESSKTYVRELSQWRNMKKSQNLARVRPILRRLLMFLHSFATYIDSKMQLESEMEEQLISLVSLYMHFELRYLNALQRESVKDTSPAFSNVLDAAARTTATAAASSPSASVTLSKRGELIVSDGTVDTQTIVRYRQLLINRFSHWLYILLPSHELRIDALLSTTFYSKVTRPILEPIFRKILSEMPYGPFSSVSYVRHVLAFKLWRDQCLNTKDDGSRALCLYVERHLKPLDFEKFPEGLLRCLGPGTTFQEHARRYTVNLKEECEYFINFCRKLPNFERISEGLPLLDDDVLYDEEDEILKLKNMISNRKMRRSNVVIDLTDSNRNQTSIRRKDLCRYVEPSEFIDLTVEDNKTALASCTNNFSIRTDLFSPSTSTTSSINQDWPFSPKVAGLQPVLVEVSPAPPPSPAPPTPSKVHTLGILAERGASQRQLPPVVNIRRAVERPIALRVITLPPPPPPAQRPDDGDQSRVLNLEANEDQSRVSNLEANNEDQSRVLNLEANNEDQHESDEDERKNCSPQIFLKSLQMNEMEDEQAPIHRTHCPYHVDGGPDETCNNTPDESKPVEFCDNLSGDLNRTCANQPSDDVCEQSSDSCEKTHETSEPTNDSCEKTDEICVKISDNSEQISDSSEQTNDTLVQTNDNCEQTSDDNVENSARFNELIISDVISIAIETTNTTIEPETSTSVQVQSEVEAEAQTEVEAEVQPQTEVEREAEAEVQPQTEVEVEAEAEVQPQTEVEVEAEAEVQPQTEVEVEVPLQTEVEAEVQPQTEVEAEAPLQTEVEAEVPLQIEVEAEVRLQTEVEAEVQPQTEVNAEVQPQTEVNAEVQPQTVINAEVQPQTEINAEVQLQTEVEPEETINREHTPETLDKRKSIEGSDENQNVEEKTTEECTDEILQLCNELEVITTNETDLVQAETIEETPEVIIEKQTPEIPSEIIDQQQVEATNVPRQTEVIEKLPEVEIPEPRVENEIKPKRNRIRRTETSLLLLQNRKRKITDKDEPLGKRKRTCRKPEEAPIDSEYTTEESTNKENLKTITDDTKSSHVTQRKGRRKQLELLLDCDRKEQIEIDNGQDVSQRKGRRKVDISTKNSETSPEILEEKDIIPSVTTKRGRRKSIELPETSPEILETDVFSDGASTSSIPRKPRNKQQVKEASRRLRKAQIPDIFVILNNEEIPEKGKKTKQKIDKNDENQIKENLPVAPTEVKQVDEKPKRRRKQNIKETIREENKLTNFVETHQTNEMVLNVIIEDIKYEKSVKRKPKSSKTIETISEVVPQKEKKSRGRPTKNKPKRINSQNKSDSEDDTPLKSRVLKPEATPRRVVSPTRRQKPEIKNYEASFLEEGPSNFAKQNKATKTSRKKADDAAPRAPSSSYKKKMEQFKFEAKEEKSPTNYKDLKIEIIMEPSPTKKSNLKSPTSDLDNQFSPHSSPERKPKKSVNFSPVVLQTEIESRHQLYQRPISRKARNKAMLSPRKISFHKVFTENEEPTTPSSSFKFVRRTELDEHVKNTRIADYVNPEKVIAPPTSTVNNVERTHFVCAHPKKIYSRKAQLRLFEMQEPTETLPKEKPEEINVKQPPRVEEIETTPVASVEAISVPEVSVTVVEQNASEDISTEKALVNIPEDQTQQSEAIVTETFGNRFESLHADVEDEDVPLDLSISEEKSSCLEVVEREYSNCGKENETLAAEKLVLGYAEECVASLEQTPFIREVAVITEESGVFLEEKTSVVEEIVTVLEEHATKEQDVFVGEVVEKSVIPVEETNTITFIEESSINADETSVQIHTEDIPAVVQPEETTLPTEESILPIDEIPVPEEAVLQVDEIPVVAEEIALQIEETVPQVEEIALQIEETVPQIEEIAPEIEEIVVVDEETPLHVAEVALIPEEEIGTPVEEIATSSEEIAISSEEIATSSEEMAESNIEIPENTCNAFDVQFGKIDENITIVPCTNKSGNKIFENQFDSNFDEGNSNSALVIDTVNTETDAVNMIDVVEAIKNQSAPEETPTKPRTTGNKFLADLVSGVCQTINIDLEVEPFDENDEYAEEYLNVKIEPHKISLPIIISTPETQETCVTFKGNLGEIEEISPKEIEEDSLFQEGKFEITERVQFRCPFQINLNNKMLNTTEELATESIPSVCQASEGIVFPASKVESEENLILLAEIASEQNKTVNNNSIGTTDRSVDLISSKPQLHFDIGGAHVVIQNVVKTHNSIQVMPNRPTIKNGTLQTNRKNGEVNSIHNLLTELEDVINEAEFSQNSSKNEISTEKSNCTTTKTTPTTTPDEVIANSIYRIDIPYTAELQLMPDLDDDFIIQPKIDNPPVFDTLIKSPPKVDYSKIESLVGSIEIKPEVNNKVESVVEPKKEKPILKNAKKPSPSILLEIYKKKVIKNTKAGVEVNKPPNSNIRTSRPRRMVTVKLETDMAAQKAETEKKFDELCRQHKEETEKSKTETVEPVIPAKDEIKTTSDDSNVENNVRSRRRNKNTEIEAEKIPEEVISTEVLPKPVMELNETSEAKHTQNIDLIEQNPASIESDISKEIKAKRRNKTCNNKETTVPEIASNSSDAINEHLDEMKTKKRNKTDKENTESSNNQLEAIVDENVTEVVIDATIKPKRKRNKNINEQTYNNNAEIFEENQKLSNITLNCNETNRRKRKFDFDDRKRNNNLDVKNEVNEKVFDELVQEYKQTLAKTESTDLSKKRMKIEENDKDKVFDLLLEEHKKSLINSEGNSKSKTESEANETLCENKQNSVESFDDLVSLQGNISSQNTETLREKENDKDTTDRIEVVQNWIDNRVDMRVDSDPETELVYETIEECTFFDELSNNSISSPNTGDDQEVAKKSETEKAFEHYQTPDSGISMTNDDDSVQKHRTPDHENIFDTTFITDNVQQEVQVTESDTSVIVRIPLDKIQDSLPFIKERMATNKRSRNNENYEDEELVKRTKIDEIEERDEVDEIEERDEVDEIEERDEVDEIEERDEVEEIKEHVNVPLLAQHSAEIQQHEDHPPFISKGAVKAFPTLLSLPDSFSSPYPSEISITEETDYLVEGIDLCNDIPCYESFDSFNKQESLQANFNDMSAEVPPKIETKQTLQPDYCSADNEFLTLPELMNENDIMSAIIDNMNVYNSNKGMLPVNMHQVQPEMKPSHSVDEAKRNEFEDYEEEHSIRGFVDGICNDKKIFPEQTSNEIQEVEVLITNVSNSFLYDDDDGPLQMEVVTNIPEETVIEVPAPSSLADCQVNAVTAVFDSATQGMSSDLLQNSNENVIPVDTVVVDKPNFIETPPKIEEIQPKTTPPIPTQQQQQHKITRRKYENKPQSSGSPIIQTLNLHSKMNLSKSQDLIKETGSLPHHHHHHQQQQHHRSQYYNKLPSSQKHHQEFTKPPHHHNHHRPERRNSEPKTYSGHHHHQKAEYAPKATHIKSHKYFQDFICPPILEHLNGASDTRRNSNSDYYPQQTSQHSHSHRSNSQSDTGYRSSNEDSRHRNVYRTDQLQHLLKEFEAINNKCAKKH